MKTVSSAHGLIQSILYLVRQSVSLPASLQTIALKGGVLEDVLGLDDVLEDTF